MPSESFVEFSISDLDLLTRTMVFTQNEYLPDSSHSSGVVTNQ